MSTVYKKLHSNTTRMSKIVYCRKTSQYLSPNSITKCANLPLLAVSATEFESPELERDESVADLDDVHQTVEVEAGQDEAVTSSH